MANGFCSKGMAENNNKEEISNRYFSLVMPSDTKNTYVANKEDNTIYILEKVSAKKGIGGFAFGLKIYKNPKDYTDRDDCTKIGELTGKNGEIYDMVLMRPTDIMYADGEEIQKNFDRLYEIGNNLEIKGINGNTYDKNQGTKGEYLYGDILKKYKEALKENWTAIKCKEENLGEIYPSISKKNKKGLKKAGYAYFDINDDGIDELFIGEMTKGDIIYDVYTMVNRKPVHVPLWADIGEKYYVCNERFICEDIHISSASAKIS